MLNCNSYKQEKGKCQFYSQQNIILFFIFYYKRKKVPVVGREPDPLRSTFMNLFVHFFLAYMYHIG